MSSPKFLRILGQYVNVAHIKRILPTERKITVYLVEDHPSWYLIMGSGGIVPDSFSKLEVLKNEHPEEFAKLTEVIKRLE